MASLSPTALAGRIPVITQVARKIFLRACSALQPNDWGGLGATLESLDTEDWEIVGTLALRHGVVGLVARSLDWAQQRTGLGIPILDQARAWRQGELFRMLVYRKAARRVAEAVAARGIRFIIFKGEALIEQVYGDLSLRTFHDCDMLIDRDKLEASCAILQDLGYSFGRHKSLQEYLVRGKPAIDMKHPDGSTIDLHWAFQGYEMAPSDPEIIWRHCQLPQTAGALPGWRMSPELTLINLASHFQVHEYEEFKPLVDFYQSAVRLGPQIDVDDLLSIAQVLGMRRTVDLAARLCQRMFIPNPLVRRLTLKNAPSIHTRLACAVLTERSLLRIEKVRPTERRLRGLICHGAISASAKAVRKMLVPTARELELRFGQPFHVRMYPRYYVVQAYRVVTRSRRPFSDLI
jgi:putative nucleotidyltransferase-like protein